MPTGYSLHVLFDHLPKLATETRKELGKALDMAADGIQMAAAEEVPVRTGALKTSGYRVTPTANTYQDATNAARQLSPDVKFVEPPSVPLGATEAYVGYAVDYAIYVHEGTHNMPARPFLANGMARRTYETTQLLADAIAEAGRILSK